MKSWMILVVCGLAAACSQPGATGPGVSAGASPPPLVTTEAPAGDYKLDLSHASLIFRVDHLGMSMYTARFTRFDADLTIDPAEPAKASLSASVDAASIETDFPFTDKIDFDKKLQNADFLDAATHPIISFRSTAIELTGANTARVTGDFTFRGVTKLLTLDVAFNGGYAGHQFEPNARIGFSAETAIKRSDYGMTYGIPAPGTVMGVGDDVEIILEAEFTGPPLTPPETPPQ